MAALIIGGILLLVGGVYFFTRPPRKKKTIYEGQNTVQWETSFNHIFQLTNALRNSLGKPSLVKDDLCFHLAESRCDEMIEEYEDTGKITHNTELLTLAIQEYGGTLGRENIGHGYNTILGAYNAWKKSPDHYKNMLGDFKFTGVFIKQDTHGRKFYCQVFGR